jgi:site-specific DNA-cytosine methylase
LYELIEIEDIEFKEKEIEVYNFEVEEDNSYVVENIIVHNCQDISLAGKGAGLEVGTRSGLLWEIKKYLCQRDHFIRETD